jgi:hypothetical protein
VSHTPGPWGIDYSTGRVLAEGGPVATVLKWHSPLQQPDNLALIAAAPDLLAACKRAADLLHLELVKEPDRTIFWEIVSAIAKADRRAALPDRNKEQV